MRRARPIEAGAVLLWAAVVTGCLLLWAHFQQPSNLPAEGSLAARLLGLLGGVTYEDPALIQRVRVSRIAVLATMVGLGTVGILERARVGAAVRRYFTTASHPINLAIFRIVVIYQAYALGYFDFIATIVGQPDAIQSPPPTGVPAIGPLAALSHWPVHPLGPAEVLFLGQVMKVACITGMIGLLTRTSALVVAFTFFYGWGAMQWYGKVDHHHHVLWFMLVLAASRSGDALSVDWLVRRWRRGDAVEPLEPHIRYGLPLRICILLMGVLYFFPGFWKIWRSGFDWFLSDNPFNTMYLKWFMIGGWMPSIRPDVVPLLVHISALGTILFELSFIFLIFGRRTFYLAGVLGVTFHTALDAFMQYGFESLRNAYVAFVDWHRGGAWVGRRIFALAPAHAAAPPLIRRRSLAQGGIVGPALVGAGLFVGNSWAGVNRMQEGWPLACYPLFDGLIDDSYLALRIVAVDARGASRVIEPDEYRDVLGRNWNEVLRRILDEEDEQRRVELLRAAWEVLEATDPSLETAQILHFYTVQRSIVPELWDAPPTDPQLILTARW